jgi:hypothetical protein
VAMSVTTAGALFMSRKWEQIEFGTLTLVRPVNFNLCGDNRLAVCMTVDKAAEVSASLPQASARLKEIYSKQCDGGEAAAWISSPLNSRRCSERTDKKGETRKGKQGHCDGTRIHHTAM